MKEREKGRGRRLREHRGAKSRESGGGVGGERGGMEESKYSVS